MASGLDPQDSTAADTIELLETRLRRLEFLLTGNTSWSGAPTPAPPTEAGTQSVTARLAKLEYELKRLSGKMPAVAYTLQLYTRFPDLFQSQPPSKIPSTLTTQNLASIVLSYAASFPETASRLTSLKDLPIPDASSSAALIDLQPRLEGLARVQEEQAREVSELRARSALAVQRWYEVGVVEGGECWAEWEGRLEKVEQGVRRKEVWKEKENEV